MVNDIGLMAYKSYLKMIYINKESNKHIAKLVLDNWSDNGEDVCFNIEKQLIKKIKDYSIVDKLLDECKCMYMVIVNTIGHAEYIVDYWICNSIFFIYF